MATIKQKKAVALMAKNIGNSRESKVSTAEVLRQAGYSDHVADNPQMVTESKGFKELAHKAGLSEEKIVKPIVDAMEAKKVYFSKEKGKLVESEIPDHKMRVDAAKIGAQLTGAGEINTTKSENKSLKVEVKGSDTTENILAQLMGKAYSKKS